MMDDPTLKKIADEYMWRANPRITPKETSTTPVRKTFLTRERAKGSLPRPNDSLRRYQVYIEIVI